MFFKSFSSVSLSAIKCLSCFFNLVSVLKWAAKQHDAGVDHTRFLLLPREEITRVDSRTAVK